MILLVFNPKALPEYDGMTEAYEAWEQNPFTGIEVIGTDFTEKQIDRKITELWKMNPELKFHVC
jgi:hypothetical protein